jgi:maltose alpha-D-glucosyltransferase/alpha-amylase
MVWCIDESLWYKNAVFYELYVRAFCDSNRDGHGDLRGLTARLDYLQALGVDCLWLLPIYASPLQDDGYDIADYYHLLPEYGSVDDFRRLVREVHNRGMRIITDLVLNHTSDQHPWFQAARADRHSPYRDYYVWSDTDEKYRQARIIFLDSEKSNWTWDTQAGQYYWHRFYSSQPDLNYDNPRFINENYPGRILLAEANQWPEDVRPYFGEGDEFHMGFHFPLMPRIFMALRAGDRTPLVEILKRTPLIPENCQWCTFLRNHDELTLEMVTEQERQWMWQEYAPEPRMRLNLGIRRRLAPLLDNDRRKIELAYSLLFTLPGSPIIYYGDEIGMGDNIWLHDRNGMRTPMQWTAEPGAGFSNAPPETLYAPVIAAPPYDPASVNVADQCADPGSLLQMVRRMIAVRKSNPALGRGNLSWVEATTPAVAAYWRITPENTLLVLNNLSAQAQAVTLPQEAQGLHSLTRQTDLLRHTFQVSTAPDGALQLTLSPYQFCWLG